MELSSLYQLGFGELWEFFHDEIIGKLDDKYNKEVYKFVKEGGKVIYDIEMIINEVNIRPKVKTGKILVGKKVYDLSEFYAEMRYRKMLMRRWLKANIEGGGLTEGRIASKSQEVLNGGS